MQLKSAVPAEQGKADATQVSETVQTVLEDVRVRGDAAVREYSEKFD